MIDNLFTFLIVITLVIVSFIDSKTMTIPDSLNIFIAIIGLTWSLSSPYINLIEVALGSIAGALPLFIIDRLTMLIVKKYGFGLGDVKLMAACGVFLGWQLVAVAFFFAFVTGALFGIYLILIKQAKKDSYMPFGPFLCFGVFISMFFGDFLIRGFF